jgi:hypothetical protein
MKPFRRFRNRWEDNIKMGLEEMGCEGIDWIHLAQDSKLVKARNKPSGCIKGGEFLYLFWDH